MTWDEKLSSTMAALEGSPSLRIVFRCFAPAGAEYLRELQRKYPFLDEDYSQFLSLTDGASLWMYEFYGSGVSEMSALEDLYERWRSNVDQLRVFPFAEDPNGNCIAMRVGGEIVQFDFRAESDSDCIVLARSFSELVGEVLMGERFYSLFDVPPSEIEDNEWIDYLKQRGWLPMRSP